MKKLTVTVPSKKFMDTAFSAQSWSAVERNGWLIKFSIFNDEHILIFFVSDYTGQTIIREFASEDDTIEFINYVTAHDPNEYHQF